MAKQILKQIIVEEGIINPTITNTVLKSDCFDPRCEGYLVCYHEITEGDFDDMRKAYFSGVQVLNPVKVQVDLTNTTCENHLEFSYSDNTTDNDITFAIKTGAPSESEDKVTVSYSLSLFEGIFNLFNPTDFFASKAIDGNGDNTVVLKVMKNANPLYYCDLSHDFPLVPELYL